MAKQRAIQRGYQHAVAEETENEHDGQREAVEELIDAKSKLSHEGQKARRYLQVSQS